MEVPMTGWLPLRFCYIQRKGGGVDEYTRSVSVVITVRTVFISFAYLHR